MNRSLEAHLGEERLSDALRLVLGALRAPVGVSVEAVRYLGLTALLAGYKEEADAVFHRGVEEALAAGDLVGAIDLLRRLDALGGDVDSLWTRTLSLVVKQQFEPCDDDHVQIDRVEDEWPERTFEQLLSECLEIIETSPARAGLETLPWVPLLSDLSDGDVRAAIKSLSIRLVAEGDQLSTVSDGAPAWIISGSVLHADRSIGAPPGTLVLPGKQAPVAASPVRLLVFDSGVWESLKDDRRLAQALTEYQRKNQLVSTLRQSTFYKGLPTPARESFLSRLHCSTIMDEPIILKGYRVRGLFVLLSGHASVSEDGVEVATLQAGDVFGELDVLTDGGAEFDVWAMGEVDLCFIDAGAARELLLTAPAARASLVELRESRQRIAAPAGTDAGPTATADR